LQGKCEIEMSERPILETERLILRPFEFADAQEVQRLAGAREIAATTLNIPHPYEDGVAEEWIGTHQEAFEQGTGVTFAITTRGDGRLIGAISLMGIRPGHQAELGYWIGKPYWNQGFCTEAARAVVVYGFGVLGLNRVHACHLSRNPASGRVMQKLGMAHEGRRRQHVQKWEAFEDLELYGVLRGEYYETSTADCVLGR
jgi:ribosomal-protein-alanine N-acetyltransferase